MHLLLIGFGVEVFCLEQTDALFANGVKDFAGGIVVHETAGIAALW